MEWSDILAGLSQAPIHQPQPMQGNLADTVLGQQAQQRQIELMRRKTLAQGMFGPGGFGSFGGNRGQ
jgi:hypothetical protein